MRVVNPKINSNKQRKQKQSPDERAVSEVLSYIFVFAIVVAVVSIVYLQVNHIIEDTRDKMKVEGLRQSYKRVQNVIQITTYSDAPSQTIEFELQGGSLYLRQDPTFVIMVENDTIPVSTGSLTYEFKDYEITYENGGIWESYYGNHKMVAEPRIFIHHRNIDNQTIIVVVLTRLNGSFSYSGSGSVRLDFEKVNTTVSTYEINGNLRIYYGNSEYADMWEDFFQNIKTVEGNVASVQVDTINDYAQFSFNKLIITSYEVLVRSIAT
ncbi:MAG: hypothetical protein H0Z28_02235 [Archaeoglobus sp.]|nr:hypothetical protein [Archaeoglobus sp.]